MIEIVNTINLSHREDRLLSIAKQAKEQNFALRVWDGIIGAVPRDNINKAFRNIIKQAVINGDKYTIIAEDDCAFHSPASFKYYIDNMPKEFDIYLGMVYSAEVKGNRIVNGYSGNTLITVSQEFYYFWLSMPENVHPDRWCGMYAFERKYIVCQPYVCKQLNGYSDSKKGNFIYDVYLEGKEFI